MIPVNEFGRRIGEGHPKAKLPDIVVNRIRDMHELEGLGYRKIARMLNIPRSTVQKICNYTRRAQIPFDWIPDDNPKRQVEEDVG